MAGLLTAIPNAVGRVIYRQGGRFISKDTYARENRRGPGGRFKSKSQFVSGLDNRELEFYLQNEVFGGPPTGGGPSWSARVRMSKERFADLLEDLNAI